MAETKPSGLVGKLTDAMAAIGRVPKSGHNAFHNYDYATETDIVEAIRGELASRNVLLIPSIEGHEREGVGDKGEVVTLLRMTFTFKDGDTGEELTRAWMGSGSDKSDKGLYKAMTGGAKYFLMKTFLVPTGDDPEHDGQAVKAPEVPRPAAPARPVPVRPVPPTKPAAAAMYVQNVKIAKRGSNAKGPWTLWIVTLTDGRELKTFDADMADEASTAMGTQESLRARVDGDKLLPLAP